MDERQGSSVFAPFSVHITRSMFIRWLTTELAQNYSRSLISALIPTSENGTVLMFHHRLKELPRPLRRLVHLLRRIPITSTVLGERPIEPGVKRLYADYITIDDVVVEVGARMGDGTRTLARMAKHVYSFEPSKSNFRILRTLTWVYRNVNVYNMALSDHSGMSYLHRDRNFSGVASMKQLHDVNYVSSERVRVGTLDELTFDLSPTSLVIDCEGSELEVLTGGRKLLPRMRSVIVETHKLSDGSSTADPVRYELARFFPIVKVDQVGNESWVIAQR